MRKLQENTILGRANNNDICNNLNNDYAYDDKNISKSNYYNKNMINNDYNNYNNINHKNRNLSPIRIRDEKLKVSNQEQIKVESNDKNNNSIMKKRIENNQFGNFYRY